MKKRKLKKIDGISNFQVTIVTLRRKKRQVLRLNHTLLLSHELSHTGTHWHMQRYGRRRFVRVIRRA